MPMHGVKNAPLLPIRGLTIGDREGRTDYGKWWKCQVEIKNAPKGVFHSKLNALNENIILDEFSDFFITSNLYISLYSLFWKVSPDTTNL